MIEASYLTTSPDEALQIDNLNAVYDYVRSQRAKVDAFPSILPLIQSFEGWYQMLEEQHYGPVGNLLHPITLAEVNEANRRKHAIQAITGDKTPEDVAPADGPQSDADKPPDVLGDMLGGIAVAGAAAGGAWLLLKSFLNKRGRRK